MDRLKVSIVYQVVPRTEAIHLIWIHGVVRYKETEVVVYGPLFSGGGMGSRTILIGLIG